MSDVLVGLIDRVRATPSTKEKETILFDFLEDNPELSYDVEFMFKAALSASIHFGVKLSLDDVLKEEPFESAMNFVPLLESFVAGSPYNSNEKKKFMKQAINALPNEGQKRLMVDIINKDLNVGAGTSTINKALTRSGLNPIRVLKPMKAYSERDKTIPPRHFYYVQPKIDAARAFLVVDGGNDTAYFLTANGKRIDCLSHITDKVKEVKRFSYIVDGELIAGNYEGTELKWMSRQASNGLLTKAVKGTIKETDALKFHFIAWDLMQSMPDDPEYALYAGDDTPYSNRYTNLGYLLELIEGASIDLEVSPNIHLIDCEIVSSYEQAVKYAEALYEKGEEGAVLKTYDHPYEPKRSKNLIKLKKQAVADVRVVGLNEGKNKGTLGSLRYATDDGKIEGDVSGIDAATKTLWWEDPSHIIGKVIEVRFMELTTDKRTGKMTLYGPPVFIRERDDKDETSTLEELQ